jgi:hypothetical protein
MIDDVIIGFVIDSSIIDERIHPVNNPPLT